VIAVACGQIGILYTGAFSAAPLAVALGLYFFCRTEHLAMAISIYVLAAGSHAAEAVLVITGVVDDPGTPVTLTIDVSGSSDEALEVAISGADAEPRETTALRCS